MTDFRTSAAPRPAPDDDGREARHGVLIDLLGAYADGELAPETASQIDAHLIGCGRCRRELGVQRALRARLAAEPPAAASPALRDRIAAAVSAVPPAPAAAGAPAPARAAPPAWGPGWTRWRASAVVAAGVLVAATAVVAGVRRGAGPAAAAGAGGAVSVARLAAPASSVPLLREVLADYRRTVAGDLPGRARDLAAVRAAMPFPVEPLPAPQLRLLAAWTTTVHGEPAAVLAYRWDERLVMQYFVPEQIFFRHSAVRLAVAAHRHVAAIDGAQGVVAWAEPAAGSVLVADVPPELLAAVWAARRR